MRNGKIAAPEITNDNSASSSDWFEVSGFNRKCLIYILIYLHQCKECIEFVTCTQNKHTATHELLNREQFNKRTEPQNVPSGL